MSADIHVNSFISSKSTAIKDAEHCPVSSLDGFHLRVHSACNSVCLSAFDKLLLKSSNTSSVVSTVIRSVSEGSFLRGDAASSSLPTWRK